MKKGAEVVPLAKILQYCCSVVDSISDSIGTFLSYLILIMIAMICWEVLLRGFFNSPTIWVHEGATYIFAVYFTLGGAYALKNGRFVNVDIFVNRFKPRTRAIVEAVTGIFTLLFLLGLIWKGIDFAVHSVIIRETSSTPWGPPIYPLKITIVAGALLLCMQALVKFIRDIIFSISRKPSV